ncbi:prepilin-type N-terminal cleavage/methylation domain-containing protein [Alteromonadaceae bacterium BrNp21-10]|nr:prepilin-type N-terminal cleavage/methylation domain-containing protein [Alteromonadaceae bacterium BrNp21-10]
MLSDNQRGFTLIEVLIAGVILFMVIATTTLVYRSALLSSRKAEQVMAMSGFLPIIIKNVNEELQQQDRGSSTRFHGEGKVLQVSYQWSATLLQAKSAMSVIDSFSGEFIKQPPRYRLWQVELELKSGSGQRQYQYEYLTYPAPP